MGESNKLVLAIDYNNVSMKAIYSTRHAEQGVSSYDTEQECAIYGRTLIKDIFYLAKMFMPSEVYLLTDSKDPWRREICPEYKGTRKKDETVNMQNIFKTMAEVADVLSAYGFCKLAVNNGEADDMAAMLQTCMRSENTNIVFISSDADWLQLLDFDPVTTRFTMVYTPVPNGRGIRNLSMTKECNEWMLSLPRAYGNKNYSAKMKVQQAIQNDRSMRMNIVEPNKVLLEKVMCGDDGDNVPPFYEFVSEKSGKRVRLTPKRNQKVLECCGNPANISELKERVEDGSLERAFNEVLKWDMSKVDFEQRLYRQKQYVELTPALFPKAIVADFVRCLTGIDRSKISFKPSDLVSVKNVIAGTKFEAAERTSNGAKLNSIFATLIEHPVYTPNDL